MLMKTDLEMYVSVCWWKIFWLLMYSMYLLNVAFVKSLSSWNWYDLSSQYVILWLHWIYYLQDSIKNSDDYKIHFVKKTYLVRIQTKINATRIAKPTVTIKPILSFPDLLGRLLTIDFLIVAITLAGPTLMYPLSLPDFKVEFFITEYLFSLDWFITCTRQWIDICFPLYCVKHHILFKCLWWK